MLPKSRRYIRRVFAIAILISSITTQQICLMTVQFSSLKKSGNNGITKKYERAITAPVVNPNSRQMIKKFSPSNTCRPKGWKKKRKNVTKRVVPMVIQVYFFTEYSKGYGLFRN
jgi:hypothetical protein